MNSPRKDSSPFKARGPQVSPFKNRGPQVSPFKNRGPQESPFKASPRMSPRKWRAEGKLEPRPEPRLEAEPENKLEGKGSEVLQNLQQSNANRTLDMSPPKRKRPAMEAFPPVLTSRSKSSIPGFLTGNAQDQALGHPETHTLGHPETHRVGQTFGKNSSQTQSQTLGNNGKGFTQTASLENALGQNLSHSVGSLGTVGRFARPSMPISGRPSHPRSATSVLSSPPKPAKLRRAASSLSSSEASLSDRFIPSHRNSTSGKLTATSEAPHPNASPRSHIKAQTSKIYQHHVAEACGLDVNSRILSYRPLPPERSKPLDLFSHLGPTLNSHGSSTRSLRPSLASERAKKIPSAPDRVLDAPNIVDDFYLNLIAWSSTNLIVIGLEDAVYVWNASSGSVGLLCETPGCLVTSLRWSEDGSYISIGKDDGSIEIWDIETNARLRTLTTGTSSRIAAHAWSAHMLTAGSKEGVLTHSDVRVSSHLVGKRDNTHVAEVCGVEFRQDGVQFCSGGNDNVVAIWDARNMGGDPIFTKNTHRAAVKAISWCPYQSQLLATGGGTSDKSIHLWNTSTGARVHSIETESQISSLNWGYAKGTGYEMVATHGYPSNSISLFNYPTLQKTGEIVHAHDSRILNGCISPDGMTLATVSGDENLKFWSLFDQYKPPAVDEKEGKQMQKLMNIR